MADSFQHEIPRARINITLDVQTGNAKKKKELPLKILFLGNFSQYSSSIPITKRERIPINKNNFDQVITNLSPTLNFSVENKIKKNGSKLAIQLNLEKFKDFHPDMLVANIPELYKLLMMRNLLKELKLNILDKNAFRKELENLTKDKDSIIALTDELQSILPFNQED